MTTDQRPAILGCFFCHRVQPITDGTYTTISFDIVGIVPVCDRCVDHADLDDERDDESEDES